ncbi:MAG TPA: Gfo/Idh/MocA family oxidoreductase [Chthoniobacterales bacterium]|nr:Gfo/Idh/MocA family oxidoreductase [Chthoniobacterales bacterium]
MSTKKIVNIGIIGGGLMGRELASALARWFVLIDPPVEARLVAVADLSEMAREWFRQIPTVTQITASAEELIANPAVEVAYVAVPHQLHRELYLQVLEGGKDLLAEKPFGIDLAAAEQIRDAALRTKRFVRCSSEFPFLPGPQKVIQFIKQKRYGKLLEIRAGFHHSSDLDPNKPINWKRQVKTCGEIGVMGDLGMHAVHIPFRFGWWPIRVHAQLQKIVKERPDGHGGIAICDTWDNAILNTEVMVDDAEVPMRIETKRLAPTEMNTWYIEVLGTDAGIRFSTKEPKTLWRYQRAEDQGWFRTDLGSQSAFPTISGSIFETGFNDCFQQMWAAFLAEREGILGNQFGCVTPDEAVLSHRLFKAALESEKSKSVIELT